MVTRPTDEEFARLAAHHSLHPEGKPAQPERVDALRPQGVTDEASLAEHAKKVMQAEDTKCFRGAYGREVYANDAMNTLVFTNEQNPERSSVYHNDDPTRTATQRLESYAKAEKRDFGIDLEIRTGGSKALEKDRAARPVPERNDDPPERPQGQQQAAPPEPTNSAESLAHVDLPKYAAAEHGYDVEQRGANKYILEKGGEEIRAERGKDGTWSYENQDNDADQGQIQDFAAHPLPLGRGDNRDASGIDKHIA
jgi:hypothetical protein